MDLLSVSLGSIAGTPTEKGRIPAPCYRPRTAEMAPELGAGRLSVASVVAEHGERPHVARDRLFVADLRVLSDQTHVAVLAHLVEIRGGGFRSCRHPYYGITVTLYYLHHFPLGLC